MVELSTLRLPDLPMIVCFVPRHLILLLITYYYSQLFSTYLASCHFFRLKLASLAKQPRTTDLSVFVKEVKTLPTSGMASGISLVLTVKIAGYAGKDPSNPSQEQLVTSLPG